MFHSVKIKNWKLTVFSIGCFLIFLTICLLMLRASPPDRIAVGDEQVGLKIVGDVDIETFIEQCGCTIEGCVSDDAITVPKTWNEVYQRYNDLQQQQGFDLRPYKGKSVRRLVYAVKGSDTIVTVLVSDDHIIASDICDTRQGSDPQPLIG